MRTFKNFSLIFFVIWGAVTCGSNVGSNVNSGTANNEAFDVPNAWTLYSSNPNDSNAGALAVVMSSSSDLCSLLQNGNFPKSSQIAEIDMSTVMSAGGAQVPTQAGTFTATSTPPASDTFNVAYFYAGQTTGDANCPADISKAESGTAIITEIGSRTENTVGSYNFKLDSSEMVNGSFKATPCIINAAVFDAAGAPICD